MAEIIVPSTVRERLESLGGRRRELWLVVALIAAVVLGSLALWRGDAPAQIAPPAASGAETGAAFATPSAAGTGAAPASGPAAVSSSPAPPEVVLVHVAGAVRRPGLYELPLGARIADAVEVARGPRRRADLDAVNLAESLVDGSKVEVPVVGAAAAPGAVAAPVASPTPTTAIININQADQLALESIPGIGPVTATAILDLRTQIGTFDSVEQLLEVSGIGPVTLENIRPYVTV
ncbi:hypothetical protein BH24ACT26_BH24ACT26_21580 [soil metagenome]